MPIWIPLALLFPALTGVVNVLDKLIVDRHSPSPFFYAFWIGVFELTFGAIGVGIISIIQGIELATLGGEVLTGAVSASSLVLLLWALRFGQLARVVPIQFLYPLMVAPMAVGFLGEKLPSLAWLAIVLAVVGAILVSWQGSQGSRTFGNPLVMLLAGASAALLAVSFILVKHFLEDGNFWQFYNASRLGFASVMLGLILLPEVRRVAPGMVRSWGFMRLMISVQIIISVALVVRYQAVDLGTVSLVAAISAVQPTLVFFYSLGLATLSPANFGGWITRSTMRPQVAGIAAITAGVVLIVLL